MKNNRGDIPITILVIGVFVVCTLALLSFFVSAISLRNSFVGIDIIGEVNRAIEKGQSNNFDRKIDKDRFNWGYVMRGFKDELLFSVDYEKP